MTTSADGVRLLLGLRLRALREERGLTLKRFGEQSGLSISYLSEIEQGRKYPKPEKLLALARGLGIAYDELVALEGGAGRGPVEALLASPLVGGFPFSAFGVRAEDVVRLLAESPERASALAHAFVDLGRTYDLELEDVLLAALRAYQEMNDNYFPDLEDQAVALRRAHGWSAEDPPSAADLARALERAHGYAAIEEIPLGSRPELASLRSIFLEGRPPRLLVNPRLMPSQRAFVLARELGYRTLGLKERASTSSWIEVGSFEQVLNNFRASYFAGALLLDQEVLRADVARLFARPRFAADALLALIRRRRATPELLFHRLTELLPRRFDLRDIFFLRFSQTERAERPRLTKFLNLSASPVPHGVGGEEHYCPRWPSLASIAALSRRSPGATTSSIRGTRRSARAGTGGGGGGTGSSQVAAARLRFTGHAALDRDGRGRAQGSGSASGNGHGEAPAVDFLVIAVARRLALAPEGWSSVALGLADTPALRRVVTFAADPALRAPVEAGLTCERCSLPRARCAERAAPPLVLRRREAFEAQRRALEALRREGA